MTNNRKTEPIKRPSFLMHISEAFRGIRDFRKSSEFIKSFDGYRKGDDHPVLVIPGFMGSNTSTKRLRRFIKRLGYPAYDWGLGRNYADVEDLEILIERIDKIYDLHNEKVSLIGWSLGGVYARELAKSRPEKVRQVITLGSPFAGITEPNNAAWLYEWLKGESVHTLDKAWIDSLPQPAPVPTTAIYSKEDGVVNWKVCMELKEDDTHQNVEVISSHVSFANNASVWFLIADRLQYKKENWKRFEYNGAMKNFVEFPEWG